MPKERAGNPPTPSRREKLSSNNRPLNQAAKQRLLEANDYPNPHYLYLVQLLNLGFEKNLPILGQGGAYRAELEMAAAQLHAPDLKPADVMRYLLSNRNTESQSEQNDTLMSWLETAENWQEATQRLMEWYYDLKASWDPYYR